MLAARFFKFLFRFPFFRKYYFGLYVKLFKPHRWFAGKVVVQSYRRDLRIRLEIDEWIQQQIFFFGDFDRRGMEYLERTLDQGDVFVDIGANIGCYSLVAAGKVRPEGKVIAFEPVTEIHAKLKDNLKLNAMHWARAEKKAVFDKDGTVVLHLAGSDNLGMSSVHRHDAENGRTEEVKTVCLDNYLVDAGVDRVDLIKIDIEGAELEALKGMTNILNHFRPALIIEVLDPDSAEGKEVFDVLKTLNYRPYSLQLDGSLADFRKYTSSEAYYNYVFLPEENRS